MNSLSDREFTALRDTVRSRGSVRFLAVLAGLISWSIALVALLIWLPLPMVSLVPLLLLVTTFEVNRMLHLGVERIGRYLQVFFEERPTGTVVAPPAWEHTAMAFGPTVPGAGGHPLFLPVLVMATGVNLLAVFIPSPVAVELIALLVPHLAFVGWMFYCDRGMRQQRARELARFREIKAETTRGR